jgi:hypothetical protein
VKVEKKVKMSTKPEETRSVHDEQVEQSMHNHRDGHVAIHTDTYYIDEDALRNNLPKRYYLSPGFIGTVTVSLSIPEPYPQF